MIVWGWGKKVINLGFAKTEYCPTCEKNRDFHISLIYRYFAIFWITIASWGAKYYYHCNICDRGIEINKKEVSHALTKNPIPWFHRYGWLAIVGVIALVAILATTLTSDNISMKGQVIYTNGNPAHDCAVYIFKGNETESYAATGVDSKGSYSFKNLPSGSYDIYVISDTAAASNTPYFTGAPDAVAYVYAGETTIVPTISYDYSP